MWERRWALGGRLSPVFQSIVLWTILAVRGPCGPAPEAGLLEVRACGARVARVPAASEQCADPDWEQRRALGGRLSHIFRSIVLCTIGTDWHLALRGPCARGEASEGPRVWLMRTLYSQDVERGALALHGPPMFLREREGRQSHPYRFYIYERPFVAPPPFYLDPPPHGPWTV